MKDMEKLMMDELHEILTAYEMRKKNKRQHGRKQLSKHQRRQKDTNSVIVTTMNQIKKDYL
jgi:hypothetical protein